MKDNLCASAVVSNSVISKLEFWSFVPKLLSVRETGSNGGEKRRIGGDLEPGPITINSHDIVSKIIY